MVLDKLDVYLSNWCVVVVTFALSSKPAFAIFAQSRILVKVFIFLICDMQGALWRVTLFANRPCCSPVRRFSVAKLVQDVFIR